MRRDPVVAGQFYPGDRGKWEAEVRRYLAQGAPEGGKKAKLAMVPHAGYMFSGKIAGKTLAGADLEETVLLLGPNHTGKGDALAVWPDGEWVLPGAKLSVASELAKRLLNAHSALSKSYAAHTYEHSLEVVIPFLWAINPNTRILPLAIAEPSFDLLQEVGKSLAEQLKSEQEPVSIVVSSDMSHFVSQTKAKTQVDKAIQAIKELDPKLLYTVVREEGITMCGVLPMTLGLVIAKELGAQKAELVEYGTSADTTGDYEKVVGYAGMLVY